MYHENARVKHGLSLAKIFNGNEFAKQLNSCVRLLYPATGWRWQKKRLRFILRSFWYLSESRQWFSFLNDTTVLHDLLRNQPGIGEKIHRPYLRAGYSSSQRLEVLREHYQYCLQHMRGMLFIKAAQQEVLLIVAQLLAKEFEINQIVGVCNSEHIYRSWRKRRFFQADYDILWQDLGGNRLPDGNFSLPLATPVKHLQEIPSNKRAEALRRREALETIRQQVSDNINKYNEEIQEEG